MKDSLFNLVIHSPWIVLGLFCMWMVWLLKQHLSSRKPSVFGDDLAFWPYEPLPIMTDSEVVFFRLLQEAVQDHYLIFSQVQLSRIIDAHNSEDSGKWLNRINRMSVDYLLVDTQDAQTPLVVIELDDWSHETKERQLADAKKDKSLSCAGIPIMRFHGEQMPTAEVLADEIDQVMSDYYA